MPSVNDPHAPAPLGHDDDHRQDLASFAALQTLLLSVEGVDGFLQEVSELATRIVPQPVSCGITVEYEGQPMTVASSDEHARAFDESQYDAHEGTCLHAMRAGEVIYVPDAAQETRWPTYFATAKEYGLQSSLSLPLIVRNESIGAINLYSRERTGAFDVEARSRAELFAAQASTALLLALRQIDQSETNQQLETALTSRSVIDQALGILMGQQRCSSEEAFALLRAHSQNNNQKLRDVAHDLVRRTSQHPSPN